MLTVPTATWPYLLAQRLRPVEVYEIAAFAGRSALYYASHDLTWGGHDYVGLAVERTPIKDAMALQVPDCEIAFSNVVNTLRQHLDPTDTLTGARITVRILFRDAANALLSDSLVRFVGTIEPPSRITETDFTVRVVGLLDGGGKELPARRLAMTCAWQYANKGAFDGSGECTYQSNTTANGAGTATTALVLTAASTFANGDLIQIGGGSEVAISAGGGTVNVTLASARTWSNGATVRYAQCDRSRTACTKRARLYRFGGFPASASMARLSTVREPRDDARWNWKSRPIKEFLLNSFADPTVPVPILYGRRRVTPIVIETGRYLLPTNGGVVVRFLVWSEGQVDANGDVLRYYADGVIGVDVVTAGEKTSGIFFRVGGGGIDDIETVGEYAASPSAQPRTQNTDYLSLAAVPYSGLAYVIHRFQVALFSDALPPIDVDGKGLIVIPYAADGTPGAAAWSPSPVWQFVDLCMSAKHGLGLAASDFDFAAAKESADYAATLITATEASTTVKTAQGSAATACFVVSSEGFIEGRRVDVNGNANTVDRVIGDDQIKLGTAVTQSVGHTVVQRPERFESHIYMTDSDAGISWLKNFLTSCRGFVTYDAGKVQFRIERGTCASRVLNGLFELWSSSTVADNWDFNSGSSTETMNRDASVKHSGAYSCRLDRTGGANYAGPQTVAITGLEPGRWYRVEYWHKQDALGIGNANRCVIHNDTRNIDCDADGLTWGASLNLVNAEGATAFTRYEATFKIREDFALTDTYTLRFAPYFTAGHSIWIDDVIFRGPYAGDFREFTTALNMGWREGSFVWSLDRKDRETNRVALRFQNESARFGTDEAAADDFTHQQTHQIKTLNLTCNAIADRDQARRIANFQLAKRRQLGTGCEFVGAPASLALQPGDVILVSHTVPSWVCKEQRVIETEVLGLGDADEHFVIVRTEDYQESIYSDVGSAQSNTPARPTPTITVSVRGHTGGVLDLSWVADASLVAALYFRIHSSATAGFTPDPTNMIGQTSSTHFVYTASQQELGTLRYYRVLAMTDYGAIQSAEFSTTIYAGTNVAPNLIVGSDFNDATLWDDGGSGSAYTDNFQFPTALTSPDSLAAAYKNETGGAATVAKINDASDDASYLAGHATATAGTSDGNDADIRYHSFGAGTGETGRPMVRGKRIGVKAATLGVVDYYYTLDRTAGTPTWVLWLTIPYTDNQLATRYGPELTGIDYTKFAMRNRTRMLTGGTSDRDIFDYNMAAAFDEKGNPASYGSVGENKGTILGDGTNYGSLTAFLATSAAATPLFASASVNGCTIQFKKHVSGDTLDSQSDRGIVVEIEDTATATKWTALTIPPAQITAAWQAAFVQFAPGSNVSGNLVVRVKTKNSKALDIDKVGLTVGPDIFIWEPSPQEIGLGYLGDFSNGRIQGYASGALVVDTPIYSAVA